jgi:UPF0716 family protein affecting phage T7 exclusion
MKPPDPTTVAAAVAASATCAIASAVLVRNAILELPADHLLRRARSGAPPPWRAALGALFLVGGALMLVLPGQGLLTLFVGLWLLELPFTRGLERWALRRPKLLAAANGMRRRAGKEPFASPPAECDERASSGSPGS